MAGIADPVALRRRSSGELHDESGQTLVEYALIIALIALAAVVALGFMSGKLNSLFSKAGNSLNGVQVAAGSGGGTPPPSPPGPGTIISVSNTTAFNNASGVWQPAGAVQDCQPRTGLNLGFCLFGGGTWVTVGIDALYAPYPLTRSGSCSFTFSNGFTFSGTWSGHTGLYRLGSSGGPDYGESCF
jgi:pilus assembly protein Flp/PilA